MKQKNSCSNFSETHQGQIISPLICISRTIVCIALCVPDAWFNCDWFNQVSTVCVRCICVCVRLSWTRWPDLSARCSTIFLTRVRVLFGCLTEWAWRGFPFKPPVQLETAHTLHGFPLNNIHYRHAAPYYMMNAVLYFNTCKFVEHSNTTTQRCCHVR